MKNIRLKLSSFLLIGLALSQNCIVGSNITYAQNAPDGYAEVAIYNDSIYPIKIHGSHLGPVGETKSGAIKRSRTGDIYTQENGNTIIQPGGQGLYKLNKNSEYKYTPKEMQANGKEIDLDSKHGNDFKTDQTWTIIGSGSLAATPLIGPNPIAYAATPLVGPNPIAYAATPLVGPNPIVAPVVQVNLNKKATRKAIRNAATPLVGPNPVVYAAAPVAEEVVNNNYYNAPIAATPLVGLNPRLNAATPLVGPNPRLNAATPLVGPNVVNPLTVRRNQMIAQQRVLNNGPMNNYPAVNNYDYNDNY